MDHQVITEELLKAKLIDKLQAVHVEVKDISGGCGQSFEVVIVSHQFEGKPLLQRHRLVNECLKEEISQIHAFTQKTYSPAQWDKINSS